MEQQKTTSYSLFNNIDSLKQNQDALFHKLEQLREEYSSLQTMFAHITTEYVTKKVEEQTYCSINNKLNIILKKLERLETANGEV